MNTPAMQKVSVSRCEINGLGNLLIRLSPINGEKLPAFAPGAHIDVDIPDVGKRQYSLCSSPEQSMYYEICVRLSDSSSGGSRWLHQGLKENTQLTISAPRNYFPLPSGKRFLLFAGGIGITPLLIMAEQLAANNLPFELHYYLREEPHQGLPHDSIRLPKTCLFTTAQTAIRYVCGCLKAYVMPVKIRWSLPADRTDLSTPCKHLAAQNLFTANVFNR